VIVDFGVGVGESMIGSFLFYFTVKFNPGFLLVSAQARILTSACWKVTQKSYFRCICRNYRGRARAVAG